VSSSSNESERKRIAEVEDEAIPLPSDAKVTFLGGIFVILFLAALYAVADSRSNLHRFNKTSIWTIRSALLL
jgi:hypothetical protein